MPRTPSPDDPQWGPARTYRARPGRNPGRDGSGVPLDQIDEDDLVDADGHSYRSAEAPYQPHEPAYQPYEPAQQGHYDLSEDPEEGHASTYGTPRSRRTRRPPRTRSAGTRRRRHPVRWIVLLLIVALLAYPFALARVAMSNLHRVDALTSGADTAGRNYLVVGSDTRTGTDLEAVEGQRTDTIMLLHVPSSGPTVTMSIPRDSYVTIPGHGKNKINAAYSIGGPTLLTETVEDAVGVHIDGYVETGLAGFGAIVDAIGGITICPTFAMDDSYSGLNVQPGCQPANGTVALAYARARHSDPRGDLGRVQRQREVLSQIAKKAASPSVLLNPFSAFPLAEKGGSALTVDQQMGTLTLAYFLWGMKQSAGGSGISLTVPVARTDRVTSHGQVVDWDSQKSAIVFTALQNSSTDDIKAIADAQAAAAG